MQRNEPGASERLDEMGSRVVKRMGRFCCGSRDGEPAVPTEKNDGGLRYYPKSSAKEAPVDAWASCRAEWLTGDQRKGRSTWLFRATSRKRDGPSSCWLELRLRHNPG